jgi:hypothetical protein
MNRRFSELAAYERARWVDGSYRPDPFEQERGFVQKTGDEIERWPASRRDYSGLGPRNGRRQDERVFEEVCQALSRDGEVDATHIEVQCQEGEVTLAGWVCDRHQKRIAERVAERVHGVRDVHNRLRVQDGEISTESTVSGTTRESTRGGLPGVY